MIITTEQLLTHEVDWIRKFAKYLQTKSGADINTIGDDIFNSGLSDRPSIIFSLSNTLIAVEYNPIEAFPSHWNGLFGTGESWPVYFNGDCGFEDEDHSFQTLEEVFKFLDRSVK